jgi:hypothetical protein
MLLDSVMPRVLARTYHFFVRHFGARDIKEDDPKENTKLKVVFVP